MSAPLDRYRDPDVLRAVADRLQAMPADRPLAFMHVCGTHEQSIARFGLRSLLPDWLRVIAGPGCPVCVCPPAEIDAAARLALDREAMVATFGDMMLVPGRISLAEARAQGGDIRVVYGAGDAVRLAAEHPDRQVVLLAVGFETTACTTAAAVLAAPPDNFSLLMAHRIIPPALAALLGIEQLRVDGFLLPGHVSTVVGSQDYEQFTEASGMPGVVAGFEPVDVMLGLERLARMAIDGQAGVANTYPRAVRRHGNPRARQAIADAFEPVDAPWRGLGTIAASGLALREALAERDALGRFDLQLDRTLPDSVPGCQCGQVMVGLVEPEDCTLFAETCNPDHPHGPCMVSVEGTCRSRYLYREV